MSDSSPYAPEPLPPVTPANPANPATPANAPAAATPAYAVAPAAQPVAMEAGDRVHAILRGAVGVLLAAAGILCQLFGAGVLGSEGFPYNAPVESFMNFGITLVLVGAGIALVITAVRAAAPRRVPFPRRVSVLAIVGTSLVALAFIAFLGGGLPNWISVLGGVRGRYDGLVGALFLTGVPWTVGTVLATVGARSPGTASKVIAWTGIGLGLLLTVPVVAAAALYAAGITD